MEHILVNVKHKKVFLSKIMIAIINPNLNNASNATKNVYNVQNFQIVQYVQIIMQYLLNVIACKACISQNKVVYVNVIHKIYLFL